jgi:AcrR family transcriptional regulator
MKSASRGESAEREPVNHRTLVGRRRRATTEMKIIQAAAQVFAERGIYTPVIDDFVKAAGIARGTFYNYFDSTDELLRATSEWATEELLTSIDDEISPLKDPARRFGVGIRILMHWAESNPSWCCFIAHVWNSITYEKALKDIRGGIRSKAFVVSDPYVAWDVLSGALRQAMFKIGAGGVRRHYGSGVAQMCLRALGARDETIADIMSIPLPDVPSWGKKES